LTTSIKTIPHRSQDHDLALAKDNYDHYDEIMEILQELKDITAYHFSYENNNGKF
jgi:hemerythrin